MTETLPPEQAHQRQLIEDSAALAEMQKTRGWTVFVAYAETWAREHEAVILSGGLTDPMKYAATTGTLKGIRQVLDVPRFVAQARDLAMEPSEQYVDELEFPFGHEQYIPHPVHTEGD